MQDDAQACIERANRCLQMANAAETPQLRQSLLDIAYMWMRLGEDLDRSQTFNREAFGLDVDHALPDWQPRGAPEPRVYDR
jgi:hypothetical protein